MDGSVISDHFLQHAVRSSLIDMLDSYMVVVLHDGKKFIGILRSFDQYSNLILSDAYERISFENKYCDLPVGSFVIRGDSVILMGQMDEKAMKLGNKALVKVKLEEVKALIKANKSKHAIEEVL